VTFDLDLDLENTLDAGSSGDDHVLLWWRSSIHLREEPILVKSQKCPYHVKVTFDLDFDLEHILDAVSSGDHHEQVW